MTDALSNGRPTPASEWKAINRKLVTLPSGRSVRIRKLTGEFLLVIRDLFESLLEAGEKGIVVKLPVERQREYIHALVTEAVIEPTVVPDGKPAGDDTMHVADFGPDLDPLVAEIQAFNGEVLQAPFRAGADGPAVPPDGEGVRDVAGGAVESAAAGPAVQHDDSGAGAA